jgi:DeoR/GlpR family transcriptional regulator of sugar metabolism
MQYRETMLTEQRKRHILEILARDGQVVAKTLSELLRLSEDTIRRDLRELAAEGLLERVHGGALPASPTIASLAARREMASDEKKRLGLQAAKLVGRGSRVFIDGGTTHLELVRNIPLDLHFTAITHSPTIAAALEAHTADVIVIGGRLYRHSMVTVGAVAFEAIGRLRFDLAFVGLTGVHASEGGTTGDFEEAGIKRAIIARAAETAVLLTSEKIGAASSHKVCEVKDIADLVVAGDADLKDLPLQGVEILRG